MFTTCRHKICQQPGAAPEFEKWGEYVIWNAWKIHLTPPPTKNYCSAHFSDDSIFCLWKVGGGHVPQSPPVAPPLPTARKYTTITVLWWYNSKHRAIESMGKECFAYLHKMVLYGHWLTFGQEFWTNPDGPPPNNKYVQVSSNPPCMYMINLFTIVNRVGYIRVDEVGK